MCGGKLNATCGGKLTSAHCVKYEGKVSSYGNLEHCDCHTVHDVLEDLADSIDELASEVEITDLEDNCITYIRNTDGNVLVSDAIKAHSAKICELVENFTPDSPCSDCNDPCGSTSSCDKKGLVGFFQGSGVISINAPAYTNWTPPTYSGTTFTATTSGTYKVTIDLGVNFIDPNPIALIGIGVSNSAPISSPFSQYEINKTNSNTVHFIIQSVKKDDVLRVLLKQSSGILEVTSIKTIIEKV